MGQFKKDMWIGLFVMAAVVILVATLVLYKGLNPYSRKVYVTLSEVTNVAKGIKVIYKGYEVGLVNDITFLPDRGNGSDGFVLELILKNDFNVYAGTQFVVSGLGMIGGSYLNVILPEDRSAPLTGRIELPGSHPEGGSMDVGKLFANVNRATMSLINADLDGKLGSMVNRFGEVAQLATRLADQLGHTLGKVNVTIDKSGGQLDEILVKLSGNLDSLNHVMADVKGMVGSEDTGVQKIVTDLNETVTRAKGLLGDIDNVTDKHKDDISDMIINLKDAAISLNFLSKNPRKFLFGGKVKGLKDVEEEKKQSGLE